jgi:F420-dependent oxidoreductase-like protein
MAEFGLQIEPQFGFAYDEVRALARLCETAGFNSLWSSDHFFLDQQSEDRSCMDCWTLLAGLARDTARLRLGSLVTSVSYRHPPVLAKIAATLDTMSNGRLNFGVGAGWKQMEYDAYGIRFPSARERLDRFEEALNIILKLWTGPKASYEGQYYQVKDAFSAPKSVQKPHPPIWIGGSGDRMLDIASRFADGINISGFPTLERYRDRLQAFRDACQRNGRDFDSVKKSHFTGIAVAMDDAGVDALVRDIARVRGDSPENVRASYRGFIGTPPQVAEFLQQFVDMGVEQFMFVFPYRHEAHSVRLMADYVLPKLR